MTLGSSTVAGNVPAEERIVRAACPHDCPDTCAMEITVRDGRAIKVAGAADHPFTDGVLCTKVSRYLERTYSPERVLHPLRRTGGKGPGRGHWERISWDSALDEIASRFKAIAASPAGPQAILPYSYAGTMGMLQGSSMDRRFFNRLGASSLERTICSSAGKAGITLTLGGAVGTDPERFEDARLIILWGANPIASNLHLWSRIQTARRRGARLVAIDPYRSLSAARCDEHVALMPGTDAAFALGMMQVLIAEDRIDHDWVARYTVGFEGLAARAAEWTPDRVAATCGIEASVVVELARAWASTRPAVIRLNYGMQRHYGGGTAARTIACLPALTGAWRDPGGGLLLGTGDFYAMDHAALERPDLRPGPVRSINMCAIGDALLQADPPVQAVFVYNSNPLAVAPDGSRVAAGFAREDLFCVVHDVFLTDTADYADIFLPATTQLEHWDVHKSYGHLYVVANQPAIEPVGESLPNVEVFRRLAARMGFEDACFVDADEDLCRQAVGKSDPRMAGIDWEVLKREGWQRLPSAREAAPFAQGGFPTASGKVEFDSAVAARHGFDPLPGHVAPRESRTSNPALAARYPIALLSPPHRHALNSTFSNLPLFLDQEREPHVDLHLEDARARGIVEGDRVRVFNDRGSFEARARVGDAAREGVAVALSLWWRKLSPDACNVNVVTSQALTDLGAGATFYDCLVEIERVEA
jgi:anaerobic selenocysteine-containing dehydrogenase